MPTPTEFFYWRYTADDGKRRTTTWRMDRSRALETLKDPEPVESSREVRNLPDNPGEHHLTSGFMNRDKRPDAKKPATPFEAAGEPATGTGETTAETIQQRARQRAP